jgi:hypothetical protein
MGDIRLKSVADQRRRAAETRDGPRQLRATGLQDRALARPGTVFRPRSLFHGSDEVQQPSPSAISAMPLFEPLSHCLCLFRPVIQAAAKKSALL